MAFVTTTALLAGKALVSTCATQLTKALLATGNKKAANLLARLKIDGIANNYSQKVISRVITFKTLNGEGQDTLLNDIYVPLGISNRSRSYEIFITDGTVLTFDGCISITGSAGQGKTTIMRKLFVEELIAGVRFPFFITLRDCDFEKNTNCVDLLMEHLTNCGIDCNPLEVTELLKSGKAVIYFDGFDEVSISKRLLVLKLITDTHYIYSCPSITTTRPDTEISNAPKFDNYYVNKLNFDSVQRIISKVVTDMELAAAISETIHRNDFLIDTINTPILISIFILTYSSFTDEPRTITDFYSVLFLSLMYKHDRSKNFTRLKRTSLSNNKLEACFSIFSYLSFMNGDNSFSEFTLRKYFHEATSYLTQDDISELIMDDVVNGTNIVVMDGYDRYVYIHRSIQEFFTAKFIESCDENAKNTFYSDILADASKSRVLEQVVRMLSSIDDKNFAKFYLLPKMIELELLNHDGYVIKFAGSDFSVLIKETTVIMSFDDGVYMVGMMSDSGLNIPDGLNELEEIYHTITYSNDDAQSSIMDLLSEGINTRVQDYINNKGITIEDFNASHVINFSSDSHNAFSTETGRQIMKMNDSSLAAYFPNQVIPLEFENEIARRTNAMLSVINDYLDYNVYKYNKGNSLMKKMLNPLLK